MYKLFTSAKKSAQWLFDFLTGSWIGWLADLIRQRIGRKATKAATLLYLVGLGSSLFITIYGLLVIYMYSPAQAQNQAAPAWMSNLGVATFGTLGVTTERQCTPAISQLSLDEPYCLNPGDTTAKLPVAIGNLVITGLGGQPLSVQRMLELSGDPNSPLGKLPLSDGGLSKFVNSYKLSDIQLPESWRTAFSQFSQDSEGFYARTFGELASKVPTDLKIPDNLLKNPIAQTIPTDIQLPSMVSLDSFNELAKGFTDKSFAELVPGFQAPTAMVAKMNFVGLKESSRGKAVTGDVNGNIQSSDRSSDFMEAIGSGFPTVMIGNADKQKGNSCYGFLCSVKNVEGVNFNRLGESLAFQLGNFNKNGATARLTTRYCYHGLIDLGCTSFDIFTFDLFKVQEGKSNFPVWSLSVTSSSSAAKPTSPSSPSNSSSSSPNSTSTNASFAANGQSITLPDSLANINVPANFSIQKMAASVLPVARLLSLNNDQTAILLKLQDSIQTVVAANPNISSSAAVAKIAENIAVGFAAGGSNPATGATAADIAQQIIAGYSAQ